MSATAHLTYDESADEQVADRAATTAEATTEMTQESRSPWRDPLLWWAVIGVVFAGAIFGFFYAWVCSTMWGLDDIDPRTAIEAMNGMNGSVRNGVFAPAFFGTAPVLAVVAWYAHSRGRRTTAKFFAAASVIYLFGGAVLTFVVNVPMNQDLMATVVPTDRESAEAIWTAYSSRWQRWNITRTVFSGISLVLASLGLSAVRANRA